jgi:feruloyl esterase
VFLGVTGFLMKNVNANPLDYVEGGPLNARREELSQWLDGTNPDLTAFARRGGKAIVAIGTNDTLASPGSQLDYYQAVLDKMGRTQVDSFARLFVMPQTGHGLNGASYTMDGDGKAIPATQIPSSWGSCESALELGRTWSRAGNDGNGCGRGKKVSALFLSKVSEV